MTVLVTGGTGMVGQAVRAVAPAGVVAYYAGSADGDLRDAAAARALFERVRPERVIHLAARVGGVLENSRRLADFFRDNLLINLGVFEAARQTGVTKVVSLLSSCVYPDGAPLPLSTADLHAGEPHPSNFGYAYAKRMLEVQSRAYAAQFGLRCVCIVPNNIYGPHDNFDLEAGHVVPAIIRKVHAAATGGPPPVLWGDGAPLRELTYADDIGRALWWALEHYDGGPLNVGTDEEVAIRTAAERVCGELRFDPARIVWDRSMPAGQFRKPTDTRRFRELSGLRPRPFAEGIRSAVRWYVEHFPRVRGVSPGG